MSKRFVRFDRDACCDAVIEVCEKARDEGKITRGEMFRVRLARRSFPRKFEELADTLLEEASQAPDLFSAAGLQAITSAGDGTVDDSVFKEIDLDKLLAFIKELLPIILEFVKALMAL